MYRNSYLAPIFIENLYSPQIVAEEKKKITTKS